MFDSKILNRFKTVISHFPNRNAFCINETHCTYTEFWQLIGKIRTQLRASDVGNKRIGLVANDDLHTYASIFAAWMEGMAYVPLHPKQPLHRNLEVISQAGLQYVLDSGAGREFESITIIDTTASQDLQPTTDEVTVGDEALAYILFTSGSTGKPKGVPITRGNLASFTTVFLDTDITLNETDRCLQCFDLTFDISVLGYLIPLLHGACVYTIPHDQIKFTYVYGLLDDHELTFGAMPPSMVRHLRPYFDEIHLEKFRYCLLSAEATPVELLQEWFEHIPNAKVYNFYGPTEATIFCTYYEAKRDETLKQGSGMLAIGKPFKGTTAVILDENLQIVGKGIKGEMYISGDQVTTGYWKNPEKNAEAFIMLEYQGKTRRFYKTGDVCLEDEDGDILYFGRSDYQVKIQGYRIELGEIEFHAREAIGGNNAVAFVYEGDAGGLQIALCLETDAYDEKKIQTFLGTKMPAYMLPSIIFKVAEFPLNTSDKIDRKQIVNLLPI
ncbi:MAG: amino acid adenylation domain-containing protein [Pricia sp.]